MKNVIKFLFVVFIMSACKKDNNKTPGVCYCDFANGNKQQYDLTQMSRQEQIDQCNTHDRNAAQFGGKCKLK